VIIFTPFKKNGDDFDILDLDKPTPPCKLWKLQSEPHDVDPKEGS
jgi:hypothetical protein